MEPPAMYPVQSRGPCLSLAPAEVSALQTGASLCLPVLLSLSWGQQSALRSQFQEGLKRSCGFLVSSAFCCCSEYRGMPSKLLTYISKAAFPKKCS